MLKEKIAVVTGASRGIGRAAALKLASEGAVVVVNYNGSKEQAMSVKQEIEDMGEAAEVMQCDVTDYAACEVFIKEVIHRFGRIDILVNNAGIIRDNLLMKMSEEEFDTVIRTNLKGTFHCARFAVRQMMRQRNGRIINIASIAGVVGNIGQANYAASKAGVIGLTKSIAREAASRGVTCNAVAPGLIMTDMTRTLSESAKAKFEDQIPLGHFGTAEDVANAVAFLASDEAAYITGQVLQVDGGMAM